MIKKTLYFGSPAYLSCKNEQLVVQYKQEQIEIDFVDYSETDADWEKRYENRRGLSRTGQNGVLTIPIEDIGVIIIDHWGISISHFLLSTLLENNAAIITCNKNHMPTGLFLNLDGNQIQAEKFRSQINATAPLKKQLWQQTVQAKIKNQAELLKLKGTEVDNMLVWSKEVRSGDSSNLEARAATFYWKAIFPENIDFYRARNGPPPNNLLNYGYAILRAITSRSLVASGLLPTLGIHHHNKYNAYCLADDVMEPYRPFIDKIVCEITNYGTITEEITPRIKKRLLETASMDIFIDGEKSPLMVGMQRTTASLSRCFEGTQKKILYPEFPK
jgi:CRISPR-associated protein Cas1